MKAQANTYEAGPLLRYGGQIAFAVALTAVLAACDEGGSVAPDLAQPEPAFSRGTTTTALTNPSPAVTVRRANPAGTLFKPNETWISGPFVGNHGGTHFADTDGDGKADAIAVNSYGVVVRRSTGSGFRPNENWTSGPYYGDRGTFFADVNGDKRADAIVVNNTGIVARLSTGTGFGPNQIWSSMPYYGTRSTLFADADGDGKADAIVVNGDRIVVRRSTGHGFGAYGGTT